MLKRKRVIALLASFAIVGNTTSSAVYNFKVFAEEQTNKENTQQLNTSLVESSDNQTDQGTDVPEDTNSILKDVIISPGADCIKGSDRYYTNSDSMQLDIKYPESLEITPIDSVSISSNDNEPADGLKSSTLTFTNLKPNENHEIVLEFLDSSSNTYEYPIQLGRFADSTSLEFLPAQNQKIVNHNGVYYTNSSDLELTLSIPDNFKFDESTFDKALVLDEDSIANASFEFLNDSSNSIKFTYSSITPNNDDSNKSFISNITLVNTLNPNIMINYALKFNNRGGQSPIINNLSVAPIEGDDKNNLTFSGSNRVLYLNKSAKGFNLEFDAPFTKEIILSSIKDSNGNEIISNSFETKVNTNGKHSIKFVKSDNFSIHENKDLSLAFKLKDAIGNESNEIIYKFHIDTTLPEGHLEISDSSKDKVVKYDVNNKKIIIKKSDSEDFSVDFNLKLTEEDNFDSVEIVNLKHDKFKAIYNKDSNNTITLSDIEDDFDSAPLSIKLKDANGNESDEIIYEFVRDSDNPTITRTDDSDQVSFVDGKNLYLRYDVKDFNLVFDIKDNKKLESATLDVDGVEYEYDFKDLNKPNYTINKKIVFNSSTSTETKTIVLTVKDFYGNQESVTYNLIKDPNKHEISHTNIDKITYGDKAFKQSTGLNFDTYISNTNNFDQKFYFKHDTEKFLIYYKDSSDKEILVDTEHPINLNDGTNAHTFVIKSKNGSFADVEAIFNIHVDVKPLVVKFMNGKDNTYLSNDGVYSNANGIFNFKLSVDDSDVSEIKDIKASIQYKDFNGEDPNNISGTFELGNHFIKENKDGTISYSLGLDSSKLPDGKYEVSVDIYSDFEDRVIELNPIKKFFRSIFKNNEDKGKLETQTITFYVDSKAPTPKLVMNDVRDNNKWVFENNIVDEDGFINTQDIKIAIAKSDIDNKINLKQMEALEINQGDKWESLSINPSDEITVDDKKYYLYEVPASLIKEGYHKLDLRVYDGAINKRNESDPASFDYTVDTIEPDIDDIYIVNNKDKAPDGKDVSLENINTELYMDVASLSSGSNDKNLNSYSVKIEGPDSNVQTYDDIKIESFELPVKDFSKEGFYKITIDSIDKAKNTYSRTFGFNIDNSNPTVNIGQFNSDPLFTNLNNLKVDTLKANSTTTSDNMNVKEDNLKSITLDIVENGSSKSAISSTTSNDFNKVNFDVNSLSDGKYNVKLNVVDKAGHYGEANGTLVIDGGKPKVNIVEPILGVNTSDENPVGPIHKSEKSVNPTITINDVTTTHDDVTVTLNGNTIGTKVIDSGKYNLKLSLNQAISAENIHNLSVKVKDRPINENKANYTAFNNNINFALDRTAPDISVTAGGKNVSQGSKIYLNAKDSKGLVATVTDKISELDEIDVKTIITPANGSQSTTGNSYTFNNDDTYSIKVIAIDKAKNESTFDFTAVVDTDIPKISIEGVKDGQYTNKDVLPSISINDETAKVTITLNGKPYTKGETLKKENKYTLVVKAEDDAGNIEEITINFVIDKTKPVITITGIKHNHKYTSENTKGDIKPLITWDDPEALLTILLNNLDYSGEAIYKDGAYVLFVKAVDKAGNVAEEQYRFNVNISKPEVRILTIEDKKIYDGPVLLDITFKDAVKYKIYVNGKEYQLGDTISEPGEYELLIVAEDEDGNKTEEKRTFTISSVVAGESDSKEPKNKETAANYMTTAIIAVVGASVVLIGGFTLFVRKKK